MRAKDIARKYFATPLRWSRRIVDSLTRRKQSDALILQLERKLDRAVQDLSSKIETSTLELLAVTAMVMNQQHEQKRILDRLENASATSAVGISESDK
ncbi:MULTISPECIES: hypothetical protein [Bradyrhizobium]|uniref:Transcriptional regulator n=2 Tax=Bradyrhizobium TaxID=374 RepID=A0ABY0Q8T5_9BRAD|nr:MULTISPECIES: hypothetical protein [Bradyrhizobium]SDJ71457.1 hypothetical protein SAMN05444163_6244 [Bradyrhizobium ottawaense]SEC22021.1 hypothetical protein SAMN05444171_0916 [Bradyrhizobium lablabi]